jgi:mannan endo-1,4-beta-mannosidase
LWQEESEAMAAAASIAATASFVQRSGQQLFLDGAPFYVNGWNSYWLMVQSIEDSTRPRMFAVMMAAAALGLTVCRTWAFNDATYQALQISPGNYDENVFQALDQVIAVAQQNGVRLLLSLVNNWENYGGKAQYVAWARRAGEDVSSADDFFTNPTCRQYYKDHVTAVLTRVNTFTQVQYCNDPTIFAWELMNEPECQADPSGDTLQEWIVEMAAHVKSLDQNHLLTVGTEGFYAKSNGKLEINPNSYASTLGTDFIRNHMAPGIDFATAHAYPDTWLSSQDPSEKLQFLHKWVLAHIQHSAEILNQPVIFTEFGLSDQKSGFSIQLRNEFNNIVYDQVYSSVLEGGAAGGALFWQFLHEEMADWNDGFGIFPTEPSSTTELIAAQSVRLKSASGARFTCPAIETTNTEEKHEHNITRILKRLHLWK